LLKTFFTSITLGAEALAQFGTAGSFVILSSAVNRAFNPATSSFKSSITFDGDFTTDQDYCAAFDYACAARALQTAQYATDPQYADMLIKLTDNA